MRRRFQMNPLGIDGAAEGSDLLPVFGNSKPAMDHRFVHLQVELEGVNIRPLAEGLIGA